MNCKNRLNIPIECLGITGEIDLQLPSEQELIIDRQMELALQSLDIFESINEKNQRIESLIELQEICNKWIHSKALENMYPESESALFKGKLFTFGSYRMGINFSGADIDTVLVCPRFISRDEFFKDFYSILSENPMVQDVQAVPLAYVPVLKMKFMNIDIDLLFANVDLLSVPNDFNLSTNPEMIMRNMNQQDVRSINGVRVTDDILQLVYNKNTFKQALKIIRIWAKQRCIYSNAMGFLGGVSWAILVAKICQLWPMASVSKVVLKFFYVYGFKWQWPAPIILREKQQSDILNLTQWDPNVNYADQCHVMPILTPTYPIQNTTHNVCESHKQFIIDQLRKAHEILCQAINNVRPLSNLFKSLFYFTHKHYLVVTYCSTERNQFNENNSLIESRLRILVQYLENNSNLIYALLYSKNYDKTENIEQVEVLKRHWLIGFGVKCGVIRLEIFNEINKFQQLINIDLNISYSKRKNLIAFLSNEEIESINEKKRRFILAKTGI